MLRIIVAGFMTFAVALPTSAQEAKSAKSAEATAAKGSWRGFFKTLIKSLEKSASSRYSSKGVRATAVAAVRGAGQASEDPMKPYWKGGWTEKAAEAYRKEAEEFRTAAQTLLEGKVDEATAQLKAFKKAHPKSILLSDVEEALKQAESAKAEAGEEAGEAATERAGEKPSPQGSSPEEAKP